MSVLLRLRAPILALRAASTPKGLFSLNVRYIFGGGKAPDVQHTKADPCKSADADPLGAGSESDSDDEDMVPMIDPNTGEWGGPTKGGTMPEPTRFGDWERAGRCTDFS